MEIRKHYIIGALVLTLFCAACRGKHKAAAVQNEEGTSAGMASTLRMNDPRVAIQLLNGFYPIEAGAWRWTAGKFSVMLRTPPGAAQQGATATLDFSIPGVVIQKLKDITLTASVNGMMLQSTGYNSSGPQKFTSNIPATALHADTVTVDFALDKTLPPEIDKRELGIIATSVGIAGK